MDCGFLLAFLRKIYTLIPIANNHSHLSLLLQAMLPLQEPQIKTKDTFGIVFGRIPLFHHNTKTQTQTLETLMDCSSGYPALGCLYQSFC